MVIWLLKVQEMFAEKLETLREHHRPVWKIDVVLSKYAMFVDRNSDEFKLIRCIARDLGVDADMLIVKDDVENV